MKVVLIKHSNQLGSRGDVKEVSPGYFRNFLQPRGLARKATPQALLDVERLREQELREAARAREEITRLAARVQVREQPLSILKKANEEGYLYGSVTEADVASLLTEKGFTIEPQYLSMGEPIKTVGRHVVFLRTDSTHTIEIPLIVERE